MKNFLLFLSLVGIIIEGTFTALLTRHTSDTDTLISATIVTSIERTII